MELTIKLYNNTSKVVTFNLLDANYNWTEKNYGLPDGIICTCEINGDEKTTPLTYKQILMQLLHVPDKVNFIETTNNRQISICGRGLFPPDHDFEPGLTINRKPRKKRWIGKGVMRDWEYYPYWDKTKWNVADTQELFILDRSIYFEINQFPLSHFQIKLRVHPRPQLPISSNLKIFDIV